MHLEVKKNQLSKLAVLFWTLRKDVPGRENILKQKRNE